MSYNKEIFILQLSAKIGVGLQSDKRDKLGYYIKGKKAISLSSNCFMGVNIKGRCDTDKEFREVSIIRLKGFNLTFN